MKVGGLGDVAGSLPDALRALPAEPDVRLMLPLHGGFDSRDLGLRLIASFGMLGYTREWKVQVYETVASGSPVYFVSGDGIDPDGPVYRPSAAADGPKYLFFSLAALEFCRQIGWRPDIIHANDWHTAFAVYALKQRYGSEPFWTETGSLQTIHNLPYQGQGAESALPEFDLPLSADPCVPEWARGFPLALGISAADKVNTVSPGYAWEILTHDHGAGLDPLLTARRDDLSGILNGIDTESWNPTTDAYLAHRFDLSRLADRAKNKLALQAELGLGASAAVPLLAMIGRIDVQKGVDVALAALVLSLDLAWSVVFLGTGDPALEAAILEFCRQYPDRARAILTYDGPLAHRIYAGADALLIPSRYEPCGLTQMFGMRYGCLPIARAAGGLTDTIVDDGNGGDGTGFLVPGMSEPEFSEGMRRALRVYKDKKTWKRMQRNAMKQDFSWRASARLYLDLYRQIHSIRQAERNRMAGKQTRDVR